MVMFIGLGLSGILERFCRANVRNDFRVPGCENYCERSREICVLHVFRSQEFSRALACLRSGLHPIILLLRVTAP